MIKESDTVYISGPMTGYWSLNFPAFFEMENKELNKKKGRR